jgi:hypothetical protein
MDWPTSGMEAARAGFEVFDQERVLIAMAQTKIGALKIAAMKIGVSIEDYSNQRSAGLKWCMRCRDWHSEDCFGRDQTRSDGLDASCRESRNRRSRELYIPIPLEQRRPLGIPRNPPRNGDKRQARHVVNLNVRTGKSPHPNSIPCFDCGHLGKDKRHEYDHYLGYDSENHEKVQVVCTTCHVKREMERGAWGRRK